METFYIIFTKMNHIKWRKLNNFELLITKDLSIDPKKFMGHPVNAFLMIKQLTVDYNSLMKSYINSMNELLESTQI